MQRLTSPTVFFKYVFSRRVYCLYSHKRLHHISNATILLCFFFLPISRQSFFVYSMNKRGRVCALLLELHLPSRLSCRVLYAHVYAAYTQKQKIRRHLRGVDRSHNGFSPFSLCSGISSALHRFAWSKPYFFLS